MISHKSNSKQKYVDFWRKRIWNMSIRNFLLNKNPNLQILPSGNKMTLNVFFFLTPTWNSLLENLLIPKYSHSEVEDPSTFIFSFCYLLI